MLISRICCSKLIILVLCCSLLSLAWVFIWALVSPTPTLVIFVWQKSQKMGRRGLSKKSGNRRVLADATNFHGARLCFCNDTMYTLCALVLSTAIVNAKAQQNMMPLQCVQAYRILAAQPSISSAVIDKLACISIHPKAEPRISIHDKQRFSGNKGYLRSVVKFLQQLSGIGNATTPHIESSGHVLVILDDDGTLPLAALQELMRIKVPLLTHALHGSDKLGHAIFIPDFHSIDSNGFDVVVDHFTRHKVPFEQKLPVLFWRGSTTGAPRHELCSGDIADCNDCLILPRVQLALRSKNVSWLDIELTNPVQACESHDDRSMLFDMALLSEHIPSEHWHVHRGVLDIDGNTNAWGHLWRMMTGSVVFKVQSEYFNAYNHIQKPWVHFVPVSSDFRDLELATSIVTSTDTTVVERLKTIADNAVKLGQQFTFENEVARVGKELDAVWNATQNVVF